MRRRERPARRAGGRGETQGRDEVQGRQRFPILDDVIEEPPRVVRILGGHAVDEQLEVEVTTRAARDEIGGGDHPLT